MDDIFDLTGRKAVITGSTKGMGLAIARAIGQRGAFVVVSGRSQASSDAAASLLTAEGISAQGIACDVTDVASVKLFAEAVLRAHPRVEGLVLNAAGNAPIGSILGHTEAQLDQVIGANLRGALVLINMLVPQMVERNEGSIIFMSSRASKRGSDGLGLYAMSKAAIDQYVRNLALELGPRGINVNSINPGPVRTEFSRDALWGDAKKLAKLESSIPMRRIAEASDVAGLALLLIGPAGHYICGQNISVDGGMTA